MRLRDGDAVVTVHGFIFYIFGYQHPEGGYDVFLKYVPESYADEIGVEWLPVRWRRRGLTLLRPRMLYSPENYRLLIGSLRRSFPEYVRYSSTLNRYLLYVPEELIAEVYTPSRELHRLRGRGPGDELEAKALKLIGLLSEASGVSEGFFGIHGSIALGMHHEGSDIDVAVYGAENYRRVQRCLLRLEEAGLLELYRRSEVEVRRLNRGVFEGVPFVVNAVRRFSEIDWRPKTYRPLGVVEGEGRVAESPESVFRPAIYRVEGFNPLGGGVEGPVVELASMIGEHRGLLKAGEDFRVRGVLEEVHCGGERWLRVVVGSALEGEYLKPIVD